MYKLFFSALLIVLLSETTYCQSAGYSIMLDGINDFIRVPHHTSLNPDTGSWSILIWLKPVNEIRRSPLITKRQQNDGFDQYSLGFANTDPHNPVPGKKIYYNYIERTGISERSGISVDDQLDSIWIHFAIIADKSKDSIYLYKNGVRQNYNLMYKYGAWPDIDNIETLLIGHNDMSHFYKGQIDELSIWNKALTPEQINAVKSDTLSSAYYSTPDSGIAGYWRFDLFEDLGIGNPGINDVRDLSFRHNHGDAEGGPVLLLSGVPIGITKLSGSIPDEFRVYQNHPNPFNPVTKIKFDLPNSKITLSEIKGPIVTLIIYDILGREISALVNEQLKPGTYEIDFDGSNLPSGIYFYTLRVNGYSETRKMILMK